MAPFVLIGALWVGLGPPWQATAPENVMRYVVLMVASLAVSTGFVVGRDALASAGERTWSALVLATSLLGCVAYLVWVTFELAARVAHVRVGHAPDALVALEDVIDLQLFVAGALTYLATASFAASMRRIGWLGGGAMRAYVVANLFALALLTLRGLSFPDPRALDSPWYTQPGFIVGIPAVPWIMPFWLGLVLLRRARGAPPDGALVTDSRMRGS